ncbi:spinster family MFS transporter [Hyphococcus luteus]|uniref:MFS transporter n=1 Tax=Hyphococcus luteus TaxID=2058213 RepID=A0A2S7K360_9PROT|nr:MFS transporter [Marinicaulis flavus]PQA86927.1 MFS transporter [Marinicaulis flavus]
MAEPATAEPYKPRYRNYVLFVLFLGYVVNAMDRAILGVLLPPIQQEFSLSYTQLGLLGGLSFALFYATCGIPIAALADRTSRKWILASSIGFWSIMTALCGLARNFPMLLAARVGTAIGEAGGSPPSHSLISNYFSLRSRGTALSIYALGVPLGGMIGLYLGGHGNDWWGWRTTFIAAGLPGLIVAALVAFTVKEPKRADPPAAKSRNPFAAFKFVIARPAFLNMALAAAMHAFVWYGAANFNSVFLVESHGMTTSQIGTWLAMFSFVGAFGTFFGGYLSDWLSRRFEDERFYMWVPGIAVIICVPFQFLAYLSDETIIVMLSFATNAFFASIFFGPSFAMAQSLVGPNQRALSASLLLFIQTMIGLGLGPLFGGVLSDFFTPYFGESALRYALVTLVLFNLWAGLHYYLGSRTVRRDIAAAKQEE